MEGETFDDLVKRLTQTRLSRVAAVRGVLASAVVGLTGATRAAETAARKRGKGKGKGNKRKGKRHVQAQAQPTVTLCHNGQTREVAQAALPGHLKHGDTLGPCGATSPGPCTDDGACQQNSDCCGGNCFNQVCAGHGHARAAGTACPPGATAAVRGMAVASRRTINATRPAASRGCAVPRTVRAGSAAATAVAMTARAAAACPADVRRQRQVTGPALLLPHELSQRVLCAERDVPTGHDGAGVWHGAARRV